MVDFRSKTPLNEASLLRQKRSGAGGGRAKRSVECEDHKRGEDQVRVQSQSDREKDKKKKKKSVLEAEIMSIMEKSLKTALDKALDDIFKDWK